MTRVEVREEPHPFKEGRYIYCTYVVYEGCKPIMVPVARPQDQESREMAEDAAFAWLANTRPKSEAKS